MTSVDFNVTLTTLFNHGFSCRFRTPPEAVLILWSQCGGKINKKSKTFPEWLLEKMQADAG